MCTRATILNSSCWYEEIVESGVEEEGVVGVVGVGVESFSSSARGEERAEERDRSNVLCRT